MTANSVTELGELCGSRQLAVKQQVANFEEIAALGQHFNGVTSIAQNTIISVEIRDGAER
jgi:hypothetical protein